MPGFDSFPGIIIGMARITKQWLWVSFGIVLLLALYSVTRLTNLTSLPIFTDEAIYIRWSQIGMRDANWRFISLTDGKQPMFTWIMMVLLKVFDGHDPLFIGRLTSVIAGVGTLIGLLVLSYELFRDKRVAWLTGFIYVILPFSAWYDRIALYDSLVATFSVWSLYLAVLLVRYGRLDTALLLGMAIGAGMLNKSSGFLTLYFLPATLMLFDWRGSQVWKRLARWLLLVVLCGLLSQVVYSVLRLSPFFHMVGQKDNVFVFTLSEWLNQPFRFFAGNLRGMFDWLRHYMTLPLFVMVLVPWFTKWSKTRERLLLYLWWALPFAALANFAKILYPRFILFMAMPLIVIAAYSIVEIWDRLRTPLVRGVFLMVLFVPCLWVTGLIVSSPKEAPIPLADRGQFIEDWPAGGGVREVVAYLRDEASRREISVYTEGTFGLMPYAIELYLVDNPNVKITGIWPLPEIMPQEMSNDASKSATYFILNETQVTPPKWPLTLIGEYEKAKRQDHKKLRFYRIGEPRNPLP